MLIVYLVQIHENGQKIIISPCKKKARSLLLTTYYCIARTNFAKARAYKLIMGNAVKPPPKTKDKKGEGESKEQLTMSQKIVELRNILEEKGSDSSASLRFKSGSPEEPPTALSRGIQYLTAAEPFFQRLDGKDGTSDLPLNNFRGNTGLPENNPQIFSEYPNAYLFKKQFLFTCHFGSSEPKNCEKYRVVHVTDYICSGGFGHVFLCHEVALKSNEQGQSYAIKFFHQRDKEIEIYEEVYEIEKKKGDKGKKEIPTHVNVVKVQAWCSNKKDPATKEPFMLAAMTKEEHNGGQTVSMSGDGFVVMDVGHLGELTNNFLVKLHEAGDKIPIPIVRRIMRNVFEGVAFMQSAGITHRDLKPDNLLLDWCVLWFYSIV